MWLTLLTQEAKIRALSITPTERVEAPNGQKLWSYEASPVVERTVCLIRAVEFTKGPHGARGALRRQHRRVVSLGHGAEGVRWAGRPGGAQ